MSARAPSPCYIAALIVVASLALMVKAADWLKAAAAYGFVAAVFSLPLIAAYWRGA